MSKHNKVNRDHYTQRGRLTPDEAARERAKQREAASPQRTEGKTPSFTSTRRAQTADDVPDDEETTAESHDEDTEADKRSE